MVFRPRPATPGTILCLASAILLAIVSFNTPMLKSMYFLQANYSQGAYAGRLRLGTLGYCLEVGGSETCQGPTVGYNFDPNELLGITAFNIPAAISQYLTYALIVHVVALGCAVLATILGLLSHISTLSLLCFPTCTAWLTSALALIALIFDLVIFYIAKSRIDSVAGASASIGISVWLTLAAWLCAGLSGCAIGVGQCCMGKRNTRDSGDPNAKAMPGGYQYGTGPDEMRLHALRDEQLRKQNQKEQGLPSFQELERQPLTGVGEEDKYLEDERTMPGALRRDGSVLNGVGVGYGRRTPRAEDQYGYGGPARGLTPASAYGRVAQSEVSSAGNAGVGSGGGGVDVPQNNYYGGYADPYNAQPVGAHEQAYNQNRLGQPESFTPGPHSYSEANYREDAYYQHQQAQQTTPSSDSHYNPQVQPTARVDPYEYGYYDQQAMPQPQRPTSRDQGLSSIGGMMGAGAAGAAVGAGVGYGVGASAGGNGGYGAYGDHGQGQDYGQHQQHQQHQSQQYGSYGYSDSQAYNSNNQLHQPQPQHLDRGQADILRSPVSEVSSVYPPNHTQGQQEYLGYGQAPSHGQHGQQGQQGYQGGAPADRPPSYGTVPGQAGYVAPPEKSQYRA